MDEERERLREGVKERGRGKSRETKEIVREVGRVGEKNTRK